MKYFKLIIFTIICNLSQSYLYAQVKISYPTNHKYGAGFEKALTDILTAYDLKDEELINQYIHPEYKLTYHYRIGVPDILTSVSSINFDDLLPSFAPYEYWGLQKTEWQAKMEQLPEYDCDVESWNKYGLFISTISDAILTEILDLNSEMEIYTKEEAEYMRAQYSLFDRDYVAIYITSTESHLIWYMKQIEGKWYLIIWNRNSYCDV